MKKTVIIIGALAILGGGAYSAYILWYLPSVIRVNESRLPAVQQAISEVSADQLLLSRTVREITDRVIKSGAGKAVAVHEMLSDDVINRLALNYMGSDFASLRSMFAGQIKHIRTVGRLQSDMYDNKIKAENKLKKKLRKLESRKKFLLMTRTSSVSGNNHEQWAAWQREMSDIDSQIHYLRGLDWGQELQKGNAKNSEENIKAQQANMIFEISTDYEMKTIVQLERAIAARRMEYLGVESRVVMLRNRLNSLSIWPLSIFIEKEF